MPAPAPKVAIVGASTLKGKEVKEVLAERKFPASGITLFDEEELVGHLTEVQGEPAFVKTPGMGSFENTAFAFFTAAPLFTRNYWKLAQREGARIIDLSEALEDDVPGAPVVAPLATGRVPEASASVFIAPHAAALVIALVLARLAERVPVSRMIVNVFEPASERGLAGVDELHKQTVGLLSFKGWPREVFEAQSAFNMLPSLGEGVRPTLLQVEQLIARQIGRMGGPDIPRPSVRVVQGSMFHSHSFSFYVELAAKHPLEDLHAALQAPPFDLRLADVEPPSPVGAAASSDVQIGDIRPDAAHERGYWIWAAADNLRLMAVNAVQTAELLARAK